MIHDERATHLFPRVCNVIDEVDVLRLCGLATRGAHVVVHLEGGVEEEEEGGRAGRRATPPHENKWREGMKRKLDDAIDLRENERAAQMTRDKHSTLPSPYAG